MSVCVDASVLEVLVWLDSDGGVVVTALSVVVGEWAVTSFTTDSAAFRNSASRYKFSVEWLRERGGELCGVVVLLGAILGAVLGGTENGGALGG